MTAASRGALSSFGLRATDRPTLAAQPIAVAMATPAAVAALLADCPCRMASTTNFSASWCGPCNVSTAGTAARGSSVSIWQDWMAECRASTSEKSHASTTRTRRGCVPSSSERRNRPTCAFATSRVTGKGRSSSGPRSSEQYPSKSRAIVSNFKRPPGVNQSRSSNRPSTKEWAIAPSNQPTGAGRSTTAHTKRARPCNAPTDIRVVRHGSDRSVSSFGKCHSNRPTPVDLTRLSSSAAP